VAGRRRILYMSEQTTQTRWAAARLRILLANHGRLYTQRRTRRLHPALRPDTATRDHAAHSTRGERRS